MNIIIVVVDCIHVRVYVRRGELEIVQKLYSLIFYPPIKTEKSDYFTVIFLTAYCSNNY